MSELMDFLSSQDFGVTSTGSNLHTANAFNGSIKQTFDIFDVAEPTFSTMAEVETGASAFVAAAGDWTDFKRSYVIEYAATLRVHDLSQLT